MARVENNTKEKKGGSGGDRNCYRRKVGCGSKVGRGQGRMGGLENFATLGNGKLGRLQLPLPHLTALKAQLSRVFPSSPSLLV
ncbi:hypothetical protein ACLOJK_004230 [Asimina triloba]